MKTMLLLVFGTPVFVGLYTLAILQFVAPHVVPNEASSGYFEGHGDLMIGCALWAPIDEHEHPETDYFKGQRWFIGAGPSDSRDPASTVSLFVKLPWGGHGFLNGDGCHISVDWSGIPR